MVYDPTQWADLATRGILSKTERNAARQELLDHMEDHAEALMAAGFSPEAAQAQALQAMGDPDQVSALLRRAHQPVLTWLLRICRVLAVMLVIALLCNRVLAGPPRTDDWYTGASTAQWIEVFNAPTRADEESLRFQGWRLIAEQPADLPLGDYRLTEARVAVNREQDLYQTTVILEITHTIPFQPAPVFLGTVTLTGHTEQEEGPIRAQLRPMMRGLNTHYYCAQVAFLQPPRQLEIRYDYPEADFTYTIDLTGGTLYEKVR